MAKVVPFRGIAYDPETVGDVRQVVAPPYDVIDREYQQALHARHPNNVIRLELGLDQPGDDAAENRYTRAARFLREWLTSVVLVRDPTPGVYYYTIEYRVPVHRTGASPARTLKGFLSLLELEELGEGRILPHENTRSTAKEDRLRLLDACQAHFSPIWSLFSDPQGSILGLLEKSIDVARPRLQFEDDSGLRHRLWAITEGSVLADLSAAMRPKPLFIADGHHRYETALAYRARRRQREGAGGTQGFDHVLMLFAPLEDPGLTILPTHRILTTPLPALPDTISTLEDAFLIEEIRFDEPAEAQARAAFLQGLRKSSSVPVFGLAVRGHRGYFLLRVRPDHPSLKTGTVRDRLDVALLQSLVLTRLLRSRADEEAMQYTKDDDDALDQVLRGDAEGALILNATRVADVQAVAAAGLRMPHKSTYFYPKPLTGLVMHVFEEG